MTMFYLFAKRIFDIFFSLLGLIILFPFLNLISVLIKFDSPGPVIFKQKRIGKDWEPFYIYKFRTMVNHAEKFGPSITGNEDQRMTTVGKFLRRLKLDELPQLVNVLIGEMSLVGPRPEILECAKKYERQYNEILKVKPGITDEVTLKFVNEELMLKGRKNPEEYYMQKILPIKLQYLYDFTKKKRSIRFDIYVIFRTISFLFYHNLNPLLTLSKAKNLVQQDVIAHESMHST